MLDLTNFIASIPAGLKMVIFDEDSDGFPCDKLWEGESEDAKNFVADKGKRYCIALRRNMDDSFNFYRAEG